MEEMREVVRVRGGRSLETSFPASAAGDLVALRVWRGAICSGALGMRDRLNYGRAKKRKTSTAPP